MTTGLIISTIMSFAALRNIILAAIALPARYAAEWSIIVPFSKAQQLDFPV